MKKSLFQFITIIPLALLLCLSFSCQKQGEKAETEVGALSDKDVAAIKTALDSMEQTLLADTLEAHLEFYTEDVILIKEGPIIEGREAFKEALSKIPTVTLTAVNLTIAEIDGRYDLAFVRGTFSVTMEAEGAPEPIQWTGKFLYILRKQEDSSWLIAISIGVSG